MKTLLVSRKVCVIAGWILLLSNGFMVGWNAYDQDWVMCGVSLIGSVSAMVVCNIHDYIRKE